MAGQWALLLLLLLLPARLPRPRLLPCWLLPLPLLLVLRLLTELLLLLLLGARATPILPLRPVRLVLGDFV